jgi:hypothetical protein
MTHREMDQFIRQLRRERFTATITGGSHWRITRPDMAAPVFAASTPSDRRTLLHLRAEIRRRLPAQPQTI